MPSLRRQVGHVSGAARTASRAKTNCHGYQQDSTTLSSIFRKRTDRLKIMSHQDLILKILKGFIRCQQQIDGTAVLHGAPGILTEPKACNHVIFNVLDRFFALRIAGFEGGEPKPSKCNVFSCMLRKTAASWNKGECPINELAQVRHQTVEFGDF